MAPAIEGPLVSGCFLPSRAKGLIMTQFQQYDLGHQTGGSTVVVTLRGNAANVRLLDPINFGHFRNGQQHRYSGGLAERSPMRITIPSTGRWYVTVDLMGMRAGARVQSSVRVEAPLPRLV